MKKYYGTIAAAYLGFGLSFWCNIHIDNWRLYAIIIPVIFLFKIDKFHGK